MSEFRCGRIAVVGRTNAGKSTLINRLVGEKVAIVSNVPQTTRLALIGVLNAEGTQFVFVDTPGIHAPKHALNRRMLEQTWAAMEGVDAVLLLIDASDRFGRGDRAALERVKATGLPWVLGLNKVDLVKPKSKLLPMIERFDREQEPKAIVPISATGQEHFEALLGELRALLPEAPAQYPTDIASDQTERFFLAELIREKVLHATRQEVPHATTVFIEAIDEAQGKKGKPLLVVKAALAVEKPNQKGILIGKGGAMLKRMGTAARLDIEEQLGTACHLELFVRVAPEWRNDERVLGEVFAEHRAPAIPVGDLLEDLPGEHPAPVSEERREDVSSDET
jgi:GTP-binding protein Era